MRLKLAFSIQEKLCRFAVNVEKIQMRILRVVSCFGFWGWPISLVISKGPGSIPVKDYLLTYLPSFSFYVLVVKAKMNEEKAG